MPTPPVRSRWPQALALALACALAPAIAAAYLLPVRHVLRKAEERLARVGTLQVALVGRVRAGDDPVAAFPVGERWVFARASRQVRVDVNGPDGRTASWTRGGAAEGDPALLPTEAERQVLGRLFGDGDLRGLARELGIDVERQSLGLSGSRVAHVVGAGPRENEAPQIWIDKEQFVVLRVRWPDPAHPGRMIEMDLTEWEGPPTHGHFPQRIRVVVGGRWLRTLETDAVRLR